VFILNIKISAEFDSVDSAELVARKLNEKKMGIDAILIKNHIINESEELSETVYPYTINNGSVPMYNNNYQLFGGFVMDGNEGLRYKELNETMYRHSASIIINFNKDFENEVKKILINSGGIKIKREDIRTGFYENELFT
jgi:hypothetical protein